MNRNFQNDQGNNRNSQSAQNSQQGFGLPGQQTQQPQRENLSQSPASAPTEPPKKGGAPKILIIIIAVLLAALLAIGGYFVYKGVISSDNSDDDKRKSDVTEEIDNKADDKDEDEDKDEEDEDKDETVLSEDLDPDDYSVIELYPDRNVSSSDLEDFAEIIDERAAVLGDNYAIEADDEKITLTIEKVMLGETAVERTHTMELLISRGNISFGTDEYSSYSSPEKGDIDEIEVVEFDRADLLSEYDIYMSDERYEQLEAIKEDVIFGLEVNFTRSGKSALEEVVESDYASPNVTVVHDYDDYAFEDHFAGSVFLLEDDDYSAVYVISPAASYEKNALLMKTLFEQKEVFEFGLVMNILDEPLWETSGRKMGENQLASMDGETIVAQFTPDDFTLGYNSEVEFAEYEQIVKARLDVLDIDYMFGTAGFDDKTYCVRVRPEDFCPDFFRLVFFQRELDLFSSFDSLWMYGSFEVVDVDGKPALRMYTDYSAEEILAENTVPGNIVYLVANDVTIASAYVTDIMPYDGDEHYYDYYLDFSNFLCFGDVEVSDDERNVLELVCSIYDEKYVSMYGTFNFVTYNMEDAVESLADLDWKYSCLTSEDERVFAILSDMGYKVEKTAVSRNTLTIYIDLPLNDDLNENFIAEMKAIYEACGFDGGAYNEINFVITDEKADSPADSYRFRAYKDIYDGKMIIQDDINGPKFIEYWFDIYELMEEDPFFTERSW